MSDPERWLCEHGDYLFRYARRRLYTDELAEDAVQETLLAALKAHAGFDGDSSERTWLTGILKHKIVDLIRLHAREMTASAHGSEAGDWEALFDQSGHWMETFRDWGNPESELEKSRIRQALDECFRRLKPSLAQIFSLRELSGLSNDEICKELGISATNAWVMLHRARLFLRECLDTRI
ncbi:MAG: sigma-70 family RNA polymerase sigma factor [Pseudomonadota bacterium]